MKYPEKLQPGATIGLVAPSSPISEENKERCIQFLVGMGYKVKAADNISKNIGGFMAGTGEERGTWLNKMFADPEVDAIFCVRGGDSGSRAWKYLDVDVIRENPKIFLGYSDITTFHLVMNQMCDFVTFHGPMVYSNMLEHFDEESKESLSRALNAEGLYEYKNPKDFDIKVVKEGSTGKASGRLTGGNITLLSASIGTPYEVDTKGKILFLEEVHGQVDNTEREVMQLYNSGKLGECEAIILGQFTECGNPWDENYDMIELFRDICEDLDIPILYNIQSGHDFPMMTLPMGAMCHVDAKNKTIHFEGR